MQIILKQEFKVTIIKIQNGTVKEVISKMKRQLTERENITQVPYLIND